jgi:aminoglycoside/choline kinase family phosphotransferase
VRSYFRVRAKDGATLLVAHYPAELVPAAERFLAARELLAAAGVAVPRILAASGDRAWMALEDLGERTVYDLARAGEDVGPYVADALRLGGVIAGLDRAAVEALGCPPLDRELLRRELASSLELLLEARGLGALGADAEAFRAALGELCDRLAADPARPCHRDFMVRNLMPVAGGRVAVIDFQDLRLGPPAYDLASLLNDSRFESPAEADAAARGHLPEGIRYESYERAVVQRALKAAGTFARFAAAGNRRHVPLIGATLSRAVPHLERLPETRGAFARVSAWWRERLAPESFC